MEGFGWFTYEVLKRLVENHPEHTFIFFFDRKPDPMFQFGPNVKMVHLLPPARRPWLFKIWFNFSTTIALKFYKCDLYFSPDGYVSLTSKKKQIAVIHDINFVHHPEDIDKKYRKYLLKYFPKFAQKAERIITVSNFSKQNIVEQYKIEESKIDVAHNGVNSAYMEQPESLKAMTKKKYSGGNPYFIFVGALHPRKNITTLLKAFDTFKRSGVSDHALIIVGNEMWGNEEMKNTYENMVFQKKVIFTGHVPQTELVRLMGSATALVYPSYYEGFGIPIIEAMQSGTPVLCSNVTAHPEVASDAALFFDPFDQDEIVVQMRKIARDSILANEMKEKGLKQAQKYNWQFTSENVWRSILKVKF